MSFNLFTTTLFHRCLPYFSLFHDPNTLRTELLLQPWNAWQAYAVPPYALLYTFLLQVPLVLWGPQCPWFSGAYGYGSRRFGGSGSGQASVEPASSAVTTSGSVRASSSYLVTIQRFISSHVFSRHVASQAPMVGRPSSSAEYQPSCHLRSCLSPQVWGIGRRFLQASALCGRKFRLPQCFMACDGLFVWKHLLVLLLLLLEFLKGVGVYDVSGL